MAPGTELQGMKCLEIFRTSGRPLHCKALSGSLIFASIDPVSQAYDDAATLHAAYHT